MSQSIMTSREFNHDTGRAKKAAEKGPVVITDRGKPSHVLITFKDYERLTRTGMSLAEALAGPEDLDFDWEPPPRSKDLPREVDFD